MQDDDTINPKNQGEASKELDQSIQEEVYKLEKQYGFAGAENLNKSAPVVAPTPEESGIMRKLTELEKESGIVDTEIKSKEEEVKSRLAEIQLEIKRLNELKTIGQKITDKKAKLKELEEMEKKIKEETDSLKAEAEEKLSQRGGSKTSGIVPIIFGVIFTASQILSPAPKAFAQVGQYDIYISAIPTNPGPSENITVSISSLTEKLDNDEISWRVDGKEVDKGVGKKSISLTTKGVGEATAVNARIQLAKGGIEEKNIIIYPSGVDVLWEGADSYAPPFYKGRVLASREAMIRVVAIPFTSKDGINSIGAGGFSYKWSRNLNPLPSASGFGQSALTFKSSLLEEREGINVSASGGTNQTQASGSVNIIPGNPFIRFYEKDSKLGIKYEQALGSLDISGKTASIIAEPFFFSPANPTDRDLNYEWKINDEIASPQRNKNELLITSGEGTGTAQMSLKIESGSKLFQTTNASLILLLNK